MIRRITMYMRHRQKIVLSYEYYEYYLVSLGLNRHSPFEMVYTILFLFVFEGFLDLCIVDAVTLPCAGG